MRVRRCAADGPSIFHSFQVPCDADRCDADRVVGDWAINIALLLFILGSSAAATQLYVKLAYYKCASCGALNAKRRTQCRICGGSCWAGSQTAKQEGEPRGQE